MGRGYYYTIIYKRDPLNATSYRPITSLSCMGKLFIAVLNKRLNNYLEEMNLLNENQTGFRQNYATTYHIFTLHCMIELLRFQKQKSFFVHFLIFQKPLTLFGRLGFERNC